MTRRLTRQLDIIRSVDMEEDIHVIGCGGIGSWTALTLCKMGCLNVHLYDMDEVENHNVASQFFEEDQRGVLKTEALASNVLKQTGIEPMVHEDVKEEEDISHGIVIFALDSMAERIRLGKIFEKRDIYIIDGRMGGLTMQIHNAPAIHYLSTTVPPENVSEDACTARAISFNCSVIGGMIANLVRKKLTDKNDFEGEIIFCFETLTFIKMEAKWKKDFVTMVPDTGVMAVEPYSDRDSAVPETSAGF